ncbi:UTP--glucose-1-phosphate uridylyltransferase [Bacillus pseudomycoides]|uniref:UTP--glucose-1-phosphate uridylyltransferase n=1 Tax=Bacillus pseudomycoides TaxID=64104 RepID=UPI000BF23F66|nr:UTP--glucose-1-phosphate uridylyltransferase [Bacillus pseudomycoides]PEI93259.1 UTP--glucose-1-phosphate uridylyltransferase [Bacillus pseudomycoides]
MVKKAVIPAAGYGTRSLPITKVLPKEMFPICGRPAIDYIVQEAIDAGIEEILIITSRAKNMIMDYFDRFIELEEFLTKNKKEHLISTIIPPNVHIQYIRQPYATGLGAAVQLADRFIGNDPFAVLLPDQVFMNEEKSALRELIEIYDEYQTNVIGVKEMKQEDLKLYGVIKGTQIEENLYEMIDIIEKPQKYPPSNLAAIGRYVFTPEIFFFLNQAIPGVGNEIQLTDAMKQMLLTKNYMAKVLEEHCFDLGKESEYIALINEVFRKRNNSL